MVRVNPLCAIALGQPEEQVLERRQLGCQREDSNVRAGQRERQRADVGLLRPGSVRPCSPFVACSMPGLRAQHLQRA